MPDYNFKNNLKSTLQSKLWNDATSIYCNHVVESEDADTRRNAWPAFPFTLTIVDTANDHIEIIKCTSLANNSSDAIVFHCDRAQESTTAQTFEIATTNVEHRLTAAALNAITSNIDEVTTSVSESLAQHLGSIISVLATDTYVPIGCVPCNGTEYTRAQFPTLYDSYLTGTTPKLLTCTYTEWSTQVGLTGNCAKFALDADNQKFKVPLLKDGDSITQAASASELGKSYKAGLPDVNGYIGPLLWKCDQPLIRSGAVLATNAAGWASATAPAGAIGQLTAEIKASIGNPIYGSSTTVRDEQVCLRHFVVLASAQNNASVFDWSNYMAALAGKLNADMSNRPARLPYIIEAWKDTYNWYRKWSDGFIEQGGSLIAGAWTNDGLTARTFPTPFSDTLYEVVVTSASYGGYNTFIGQARKMTASTFVPIVMGCTGSWQGCVPAAASWVAFGY